MPKKEVTPTEKSTKAKNAPELDKKTSAEEISAEVEKVEVAKEVKSGGKNKVGNVLSAGKTAVTNNYKKLLVVLIPVVFAIVFIAIAGKLVNSGVEELPDYPIVFLTDDDKLMVMGPKNKEPIKIADSFEDDVEVLYANEDTNLFMYLKEGGLYYFNVKKATSEKIASDVANAQWSKDDKKIIYLTNEGSLYVYNMKDKEKIDSDVEELYAVTNKYVVYEKDENLYAKDFKSSKSDRVKIASEARFVAIDEKETKVLYYESDEDGSDYSVYIFKKEDSKKIANNAYTLYDISDDFTEVVYSVKKKSSSLDISKILNDDKKEDDENIVVCDYMDYYSNKCSYDEYDAYLDAKYDIEARNEIREFVKEKYEGDGSYDIYYAKDGKDTKIAEGVSSVLAADYETKRVVYTQNVLGSSKKLKISEYTSVYSFESAIEDAFVMDLFYKQNSKDAHTVESDISVSSAYLKDNELYYTVSDGDTYELYYAKVSGAKTGTPKLVDEDLSSATMHAGFKKGFLYGVDYSEKTGAVTLKIVSNGKAKDVANDVDFSSVAVSAKENKVYFLYDYDDEGTLGVSTGGKPKELAKDIYGFLYVNDGLMYAAKDFSTSSYKFDLYMLKGKKLVKVANDVVDMSYPGRRY